MNLHPIDDSSIIRQNFGELRQQPTGHSILIRRARDRVEKRNQNYLGFFYGATGSGKSYAALSFAQEMNQDFPIEHVFFRPREFFSLLSDQKFRDSKGVKVILWDEMGVGMPSKEWYSFQNKAISYILQTFRIHNIVFLSTAPSESFVDASVRPLFHQFFETVMIDRKAQYVYAKPFDIIKHRNESKAWTVYPRYRHRGVVSTITNVAFGLPSVKLVHAYEKLHRQYKEELQDEMGLEVDALEQRKAFGRLRPEDIIPLVLKDWARYVREYQGRRSIDETKIILQFGVGRPNAKVIKRAVEEKLREDRQL